MSVKALKEAGTEIQIMEAVIGQMDFCIMGTTPLIVNRMSMKVWQELLLPKGRKTSADKQSTLKHDTIKEFRDSPYTIMDDNAPTFIACLPTWFKGGMKSAALDAPGAKKSQIGRLVYVEGTEYLPIFGIPKIFMSITRSADMNKTPDVRTRAILPEWACRLTVKFTKPILKEQSIANLLASAGFQSGAGDWRQEKGSGNYGCYKLVSNDDPDFVRITSTQGRAVQIAAMNDPVAHNLETEEMLAWFKVEVKKRGFKATGVEWSEQDQLESATAIAQQKTRGKKKLNGGSEGVVAS